MTGIAKMLKVGQGKFRSYNQLGRIEIGKGKGKGKKKQKLLQSLVEMNTVLIRVGQL